MKPGQILQNKYQIDKELTAKGGFGVVYLGTELGSGTRVAVKEIRAQNEKTAAEGDVTKDISEKTWEKKKEEFLEEAVILESLKSIPQVVKVFSHCDEGETAYIVMEFLNGKTLKEARPQGRKFPPEEAYRIITELLAILKRVHECGIIHRDIAPDNIFILHSGKIKLFDFGIAHRFGEGQEQNDWVDAKKKGYTPLEQLQKSKNQGPWTDVYAAAATYYEMLTGTKPPDADDRRGKDTITAPVGAGAAISAEEERVILEALAVDAKRRISTAAEFLERLQKAHKKSRNRKGIRLLLAAAGILCLGAVGYLAVFSGLVSAQKENIEISEPAPADISEKEDMQGPETTEPSGELTLPSREGMTSVPDVAGMNEKDASIVLEQRNLTYSKTAEASLIVPQGVILRQEPAAGTEVEEGTEIQIIVSLGSPEEETTVPLVTLAPRTTEAPATAAPERKKNTVSPETQAPAAPTYAEPPTISENMG